MEFSENQPIYQQIAEYFCEKILMDKWKETEKIPSVREIAVLMEVNPNTAMRAFLYLQDLDIIYNKRGIGYFVSKKAREKVKTLKRKEFIENEVPAFFKTMKMLDLTYKELEMKFNKKLK